MDNQQEDEYTQAFSPAPGKVSADKTSWKIEANICDSESPCVEGYKLTPGNIPGRGYKKLDEVSNDE